MQNPANSDSVFRRRKVESKKTIAMTGGEDFSESEMRLGELFEGISYVLDAARELRADDDASVNEELERCYFVIGHALDGPGINVNEGTRFFAEQVRALAERLLD